LIPIYPGHGKNISVIINIPEDIGIPADRYTTENILSNLFTNAIKFTSKHGNIRFSAQRIGQMVEIRISDNGIGIPENIIPRLFHPDNNISTSGTDGEKGSGLGLLLCKEFVELNSGTIVIASKMNEGTTFIISYPVGKLT